MIEIQRIKENKAEVIEGLKKRGIDSTKEVEQILLTDQEWRDAKTALQELSSSLNMMSKKVGQYYSTGETEKADELKQQSIDLKKQESEHKIKVEGLHKRLHQSILQIPNILHPEVPYGTDADDNEVVFEHGESPGKEQAIHPHWDLAKTYGLIDFELGVKVTGAGFPFYRGKGAKLQRALISFFIVL